MKVTENGVLVPFSECEFKPRVVGVKWKKTEDGSRMKMWKYRFVAVHKKTGERVYP